MIDQSQMRDVLDEIILLQKWRHLVDIYQYDDNTVTYSKSKWTKIKTLLCCLVIFMMIIIVVYCFNNDSLLFSYFILSKSTSFVAAYVPPRYNKNYSTSPDYILPRLHDQNLKNRAENGAFDNDILQLDKFEPTSRQRYTELSEMIPVYDGAERQYQQGLSDFSEVQTTSGLKYI